MKKQDIITILFTFLCGLLAGSYLFLVGFKPQVEKISSELIPSADPSKIITIEGRQYGGCESAGQCASFKIEDSGRYFYLATSVPTARGPYSGAIPRRDWQHIRNQLSLEILSLEAQVVESEICAIDYDLVDYQYEILFLGEVYSLNTCGTKFDKTSDLGETLDWLWQFFVIDRDD